jgi:hypothetical protein
MKSRLTCTRGSLACAIALVGAVCFDSAFGADLNGFLRERGHGTAALSFTSEGYDEFWVGDMKVEDPGVGEVETRSISLWFAYGITDNLTLIGDVPWIDTEGDGAGEFEENGFQDLTLLLARRLGSVGSTVRSDFIGAIGARAPVASYEANSPVDIGDGSGDWLLRFVYQLNWRGFYFSQQIGYDLRGSNDAPDGVPLYTEVGQTWGPVTVSGFYSRHIANGGTDIGDPGFTFPSNGDEFKRAGAKVYGRIVDRFGLAGSYFTTIDGRNAGDASGGSLSAVLNF